MKNEAFSFVLRNEEGYRATMLNCSLQEAAEFIEKHVPTFFDSLVVVAYISDNKYVGRL